MSSMCKFSTVYSCWIPPFTQTRPPTVPSSPPFSRILSSGSDQITGTQGATRLDFFLVGWWPFFVAQLNSILLKYMFVI